MKVEEIELAKLTPYPVQVRIHTERQIEEYKKSIELFDQNRPMLVDENNVVLAGNGLFRALSELGRKTGWIKRYTTLSDADKKKLVLADNAIASLGKDNNENIVSLIGTIGDLQIPGFDTDLLKAIIQDPIKLNAEVENFGNINDNQKEVMSNFQDNNQNLLDRIGQERTEQEQKTEQAKVVCPNCGTVIV